MTGGTLDRGPLDARARILRARQAAYTLHAQRDARETTAAARATFLRRFELEVDPDGVLPEAERLRRATCARKAYFTRLALQRLNAKRKAAGRVNPAAEGVRDDNAQPSS